MSETTKTTGFFDKLMDMSDEDLEEGKKALLRRKVKRYLESAYDNLLADRLSAEEQIQKVYERARKVLELTQYDMNDILGWRRDVEKYDAELRRVAQEYKHLFGEELDK